MSWCDEEKWEIFVCFFMFGYFLQLLATKLVDNPISFGTGLVRDPAAIYHADTESCPHETHPPLKIGFSHSENHQTSLSS